MLIVRLRVGSSWSLAGLSDDDLVASECVSGLVTVIIDVRVCGSKIKVKVLSYEVSYIY